MIKKVIYSALKVNENERIKILNQLRFSKKYFEHITLNYIGPKSAITETPYADKNVLVTLKNYYSDENAEACTISFDDECAKEIWNRDQLLHITLSCADNIKPFYSNKLIENTSPISSNFDDTKILTKIAYFVDFDDGTSGWIG